VAAPAYEVGDWGGHGGPPLQFVRNPINIPESEKRDVVI